VSFRVRVRARDR